MNPSRYWLPVALLASLALTACQAPNTSLVASSISPSSSSTRDYFFALQGSFQIAAVDAADQSLINEVKAGFISDLEAGREADYRRSPSFSIHLLAGSEGSYFTSPDFIQNSVESLLATLVIPQTSGTPLIFKGEFRADRFYFADPAQQLELTTASKAYLLTADSSAADYVVQTYKGEVQPADSSERPDTPTASPEATEAEPAPVDVAPLPDTSPAEHADYRIGPLPMLLPGQPAHMGLVYREGRAAPVGSFRAALPPPAAYLDGKALYPLPQNTGRMSVPTGEFGPRPANWQQDPFAEAQRSEAPAPLYAPHKPLLVENMEAVPATRTSRAPKLPPSARAWSKGPSATVFTQP